MTVKDLYADPTRLHRDRRAEAVAEVIRRDGLEHAGEALLKSGRALVVEYTRHGPGSLWREASRVTAPTLVIHGSHDRLVNPSTAARAARSFRYGRVVLFPRIGHVAMMERPDLVAAEMQEFLAAAARSEAARSDIARATNAARTDAARTDTGRSDTGRSDTGGARMPKLRPGRATPGGQLRRASS
jgi:hypothetical protein